MHMLLVLCTAFYFSAFVLASGHRHEGSPLPPFLQNVTDDGRKAYFDIVSNRSLTVSQIDTQTAEWAKTNRVSAIYDQFQQNKTALETELETNLTAILGNLDNVNVQLNTIFRNKDQTRELIETSVGMVRKRYPVEVGIIMSLKYPRPEHGPLSWGDPREPEEHNSTNGTATANVQWNT